MAASSISSNIPSNIPTVTEADLLDFHKKAFGQPFTGQSFLSQHVQHYVGGENGYGENDYGPYGAGSERDWEGGEREADDDDDGLGYYPDGVKRTLTDEQIAMFRHSEIQKLLRERRHAREAAEAEELEEAADGGSLSPAAVMPSSPRQSEKRPASSGRSFGGKAVDSAMRERELAEKEDEEEEEEREYARFLAAERIEFQRAAAARRNGERTTYNADDRTISTRRRVRELDDMQVSTDTLMYDDEDSGSCANPTLSTDAGPDPKKDLSPSSRDNLLEPNQPVKAKEGRKIWWPEIRPSGIS